MIVAASPFLKILRKREADFIFNIFVNTISVFSGHNFC